MWWSGDDVTGSEEVVETIINSDKAQVALCERGWNRLGPQGGGQQDPTGTMRERRTGVVRALAIPDVRAGRGCYDARRREKKLFLT